MTDRELLEAAAKAAGMDVIPDTQGLLWMRLRPDQNINYEWNPLTDDGDALRLAVKLGMDVYLQGECVEAGIDDGLFSAFYVEPKVSDPYAATRRAIVRAAAEIGRGME